MKKSITISKLIEYNNCFVLKRNAYTYCLDKKLIVKLNSNSVLAVIDVKSDFVDVFVEKDMHRLYKKFVNKMLNNNYLCAL